MLPNGSLPDRRLFIILVVTIVAFLPVLNADFVEYDDPLHVVKNDYVQHPGINSLKAIFLGDACVLYVPITTCSYYLDIFFGGSAACFHTINLLFHLFNVVLLYRLLRMLKIQESLLFLVLVFFAVSPVATESVCWITERKDVLYVFFLLSAAIFFLRCLEKESFGYYWACLILFILSCLSKPMAVTFPALMMAYLYANGKLRVDLLKILPFVTVSAVACFITCYFILVKNGPVSSTHFSDYSFGQKGFMYVSELGFYFTRFWCPVNLSLFYSFPEPSGLYSFNTVICFAAGLVFLSCLWIFRSDKRNVTLLCAWMIMLLPVIQIVPNSQSYVNERYLYLTLTFPVYFSGCALVRFFNKEAVLSIAYCLLPVFAVLTFKQAGNWHNTETLFKYELSLDRKNGHALNILGHHYIATREFNKAEVYLSEAVFIDSANATFLNNYGCCLEGVGKADSAMIFLKRAISHRHRYLEAHNNLGACLLKCGQSEKALEEFKKAEKINRDHPDVKFNLGIIYFFSGQRSLGISYLKNAARKNHKKALEFVVKYRL